jgi:hypothetical protein
MLLDQCCELRQRQTACPFPHAFDLAYQRGDRIVAGLRIGIEARKVERACQRLVRDTGRNTGALPGGKNHDLAGHAEGALPRQNEGDLKLVMEMRREALAAIEDAELRNSFDVWAAIEPPGAGRLMTGHIAIWKRSVHAATV